MGKDKILIWTLGILLIFWVAYAFYLARLSDKLAKELTACGEAGLAECQKNSLLQEQLNNTNT